MTEENAPEWYFSRRNERYGPFTLRQIREYLKVGEISSDDYLWSPSTIEWVPANLILDEMPQSIFQVKAREDLAISGDPNKSTRTEEIGKATEEASSIANKIKAGDEKNRNFFIRPVVAGVISTILGGLLLNWLLLSNTSLSKEKATALAESFLSSKLPCFKYAGLGSGNGLQSGNFGVLLWGSNNLERDAAQKWIEALQEKGLINLTRSQGPPLPGFDATLAPPYSFWNVKQSGILDSNCGGKTICQLLCTNFGFYKPYALRHVRNPAGGYKIEFSPKLELDDPEFEYIASNEAPLTVGKNIELNVVMNNGEWEIVQLD